MKYLISLLLFVFSLSVFGQEKDIIEWKTIQQADSMQLNGDPRFLFMDVYTDWCGPCKLMDKYTFHNTEVAAYVNENFIPVKFNAEAKEDITFKGKTYQWITNQHGGGIQSYAYFALGGQLRYPSVALVNTEGQTVMVITGFFQAEEFLGAIKDAKNQIEKDLVFNNP